jgi:hypothetical protein
MLTRLRAAEAATEAPDVERKSNPMNYKEVELSGSEKLNHFSIVIAFLAPLPILLPTGLQSASREFRAFVAMLVLIAAFAFWWQKRVLRYTKVRTVQCAEANHQAVLLLAEKLGWAIIAEMPSESLLISVPGFPKTLASWGERVSVRFLGSEVYVNSICDPNRYASVSAYGRNGRNVRAVVRAIDRSQP